MIILAAPPALAVDGREILRKVDDLWRGESSAAMMTMHIKTEHWEEVPLERLRVSLAPQRNGRFELGMLVAF